MKLTDFDYSLPIGMIAQEPVSPRDNSRLMVVNSKIEHKRFSDIVDYLSKGDVLVVNETKVVPAKIVGKKKTGTKVELIVEKVNGRKAECWIKSKNPRVGNRLIFGKFIGEIVKQKKAQVSVVFNADVNLIMKKIGEMPIPPYVKRKLDRDSQYQTVYSKKKGSIAAPTAGLHFTKRLLKKIKAKGVKLAKVCLHVDFGTFLPVRDLKGHKMHPEYFEVDKKNAAIINNAKRLIVVGTTSMRALESVAKNGKIKAGKGNTALFVKPGYRFKMKYDAMITNFHLPKSTLLMLVSAFVGRKKILKAYKEAVKKKYRFFSFGDAMLLCK